MATLVLTTIGTALGGSLGGALGGLVGQSIDQQLFGPGQRKGPRLGDLSVQTSNYGSPIPRVYGTMRVAGSVIWATDLKEEESIEGGGKSGPERTTYNYSVNLAVALSSRPVQAVGRIWADGKLIRGAGGDFKVKTKFRLRTGGEDQPIDPLIASVETISQTPAYRGLALAIFEDLELAEFGNRIPMLTFEVIADNEAVPLSMLLEDASRGVVEAGEGRPIAGFAAHGSSIRDSIVGLIELCGIDVTEQGDLLTTPAATPTILLAASEMGCDAAADERPRAERLRAAESAQPSALSMNFYDSDRDYQTGQARSASGIGGFSHERIELPAVLAAGEARQLVEQALARRWRRGERLRLRLPPSRMNFRPGVSIQPRGSARAWVIRSVSIEGLAVAVEAEVAPVTVPVLPADGGRAVTEPDVLVGRSDLALFELPALGDAPDTGARAYVAASNAGRWKPVPVQIAIGTTPLDSVAISRRAVMGVAETALDARAPLILDDLSSVLVRLTNPAHILLNADRDALMNGTNLAIVGDELIQFARAEQLETALYRLSGLLRGRRGTEWAAITHQVGDRFCLIDSAAISPVNMAASSVGAALTATAHGIGDAAPLPTVQLAISGESMRPPSPCQLRLERVGADLIATWTRRSHRGWAWIDGVGVADDPFPERYRLTVTGPTGQATIETDAPSASLAVAQLPGQAGDTIVVAAATIGTLALSRKTSTSIII